MANVDGVSTEIMRWLETRDPEAKCALVLTAHELGMLHLGLELVQSVLEHTPGNEADPEAFGPVREKVEKLLVQGGYGGAASRTK